MIQILLGILFVGIFLAHPDPTIAQDQQVLAGSLINGTEGGPTLAHTDILLHIVRSTGEVETKTYQTNSQGEYSFHVGAPEDGATYILATSYQGVQYSDVLEPPFRETSILKVYETTTDIGILGINSAVLRIKRAENVERTLSGFEVLTISNSSDHTYVSDLSDPTAAIMNFLRFSLPPASTDLRVDSDLIGGDILNVGNGFAMTSPIPPGKYVLAFSYMFPYDGSSAQFNRTFHLPTGSFQVLLPQSFGQVSSANLVDGEPMVIGNTSYKIKEVPGPSSAGTKMFLKFEGLPQPPWHKSMSHTLLQGPIPKTVIVSMLVVVLSALLTYGLASRGNGHPVITYTNEDGKRGLLIEALADLDDYYEQANMPHEKYRQRRQVLKSQIIEMIKTDSTQ
jgi:hypothetical protein